MIQIHDTVNAFCSYSCEVTGRPTGPLQGLRFGLKDIFDVEGCPTGFGSPAWLKSHAVATETTHAVTLLHNAGATLVGKTQCDELTYNLFGNNLHYGTPLNSKAPNRMPGGSSNGSASALAAGLVDFSIGSDTGGSVRAPASFCGLFGIRPTHNRIPMDHACSLAPSFDTLGWFTNSPQLLKTIGEVLLQKTGPHQVLGTNNVKIAFFKEAFAVIDHHIADTLKSALRTKMHHPLSAEASIGEHHLTHWADQFRVMQGSEIWQNLGPWVEQHWADLSAPTKARFEIAKNLPFEAIAEAKLQWPIIRSVMDKILEDQYLILPTVAGIAPLLDAPLAELEIYRKQCFQLLSVAGLCGLPQISIPLTEMHGAPLGISIIGARGSDLPLLQLACELFTAV